MKLIKILREIRIKPKFTPKPGDLWFDNKNDDIMYIMSEHGDDLRVQRVTLNVKKEIIGKGSSFLFGKNFFEELANLGTLEKIKNNGQR